MKKPVRMRDVAEAVGVSPMTVSRAFKPGGAVDDETRAKVLSAANRLGYVFDSTASTLRSQRTGFVAVTIPSLNNANFADTFRTLNDSLETAGLQILLGSTDYRVKTEEKLVDQLLRRRPEAIVLTGSHHSERTREMITRADIPVIEIWDQPEHPLGHVIGFSNADAIRPVVRHLAETGRKKLGFVGASDTADFRGRARRLGVLDEAARLGLPTPALISAGPAPVSMVHGARAVADNIADIRKLDALICVSDQVAFGAMSECARQGMHVPGDLAVTGFGAFEIASVSSPTITTVDVQSSEIGSLTGTFLVDLLQGRTDPSPLRCRIRTSLRLGNSS